MQSPSLDIFTGRPFWNKSYWAHCQGDWVNPMIHEM